MPDIQLFQLAVEVGALQPGLVGNPRHAAAFFLDQVFEIHALEGIARFAQRDVERNAVRHRRCGQFHRGEHAADVGGVDLIRQRGNRQGAHHVAELRQIARPVEVAQLVQGRRGQPPHRADAFFHQLCQHEIGDIGYVFTVVA